MEDSSPESTSPMETPPLATPDTRLEKFAQRISLVAGVGGWEVDLAQNSVYWSAETARIHDCPEGYQLALQEGLDFYTQESVPIITKAVEECIALGKAWDLELTIRTAKGRIRWVHTIGEAEFVEGRAVRLFGTFQDITEWVEMRLQAQREKERMQNLITHLRSGLVVLDRHGAHLSVNPAFAEMSGFTEAELLGVPPPHPYWDHEQLPLIEAAFAKTLAGNFDTFELPLRRKNGKLFWAEVTPSCWRGPDGEVEEFFATIVDVTERRQMRLELQASRDQFESMVENIPGTAFRCLADEHWTVLYMNTEIDGISGYPVSDFLHNAVRSYASIIHPEDQADIDRIIRAQMALNQPWDITYRVTHRDGSIRWVWEKGRAVCDDTGRVLFLDGFLSDITAKKALEREIERKEERFRLLFESHPDGTLLVEADTGHITFFNRVAHERLGYSAEEFSRMRLEDLEEFKSEEEWNLRLDRIRRRGADDYETVHHCRDGSTLDIYTTIRGVRVDGKPFLLCVLRDITHYKTLEQGLRRQVALNRCLLDSMPDVIFFKDMDGRYIGANQPFLDLVGKEGLEVLGDTDYELFDHQAADFFREHDRKMLESGQSRTNEEQVVYPDGREVWLETLKAPLRDTDGSLMGLIGIGRNITERKAMEERLRTSDEMLQKLSAQVPGVIYQYQLFPSGRSTFPFSSQGMRMIFEVTPEEAQKDAQAALSRIHPEDVEMVGQSIQKSAETLDRWELDYRVILPKQGLRWLRGAANPQKLEDGSVLWHGYISDITDRKFAEKVLKDKTEELDRYFQSSLDLLCISTLDGRFLRLNPMWQEVLGYKTSELEGLPFLDLVHPDDLARTRQAMEGLRKDKQALSFENRYRARDGSYRWIEWRSRPVEGLIYAVARDVTDRRATEEKLREQARILEFILEDVLAGYWDWQVDENREYYSPKMLEVLGRSEEAIPTTPEAWQRWIDPEDLAKVMEVFQQHQSSRGRIPYRSEVRYHKPDGTVIWILCVGQIIEWSAERSESCEPRARRMIGVHLDITESKRAELQLEQTNQQLNRAIAQADALRHQAEEASRAKSAFLATMSHEIRTPMNAVIGMASLLQSTELDEEQREFATTIQQGGQTLLALINDILDFSKIEAGELTLENVAFNLRDCVSETLDLCSAMVGDKNLELDYTLEKGTPEWILGDVARLKQVLINLLGNAVKFTERGAVSVRVSTVEGTQEEGWRLQFEVKDSGIGMSEEAIGKLFRPFSQGDSSVTRRFGGTGLGLTISKRIVEAMGGEIRVRSQEGQGSVFSFEVQLGPASAPSSDQSPSPIEPPKRPQQSFDAELAGQCPLSILVCEDNVVNQRVIGHMLQRFGYAPLFAADGIEGLEVCARQPVDLIFLDLQMPRMGGLEMARVVRQQESEGRALGPRCHIAALTAAAMQEDQTECLEAGMDFYLSKPVQANRLEETIRLTWQKLDPQHRECREHVRSTTASSTPAAGESGAVCIDEEQIMSLISFGQEEPGTWVVSSILEDFCTSWQAIRRELESGKDENLARVLHKLKGASRSIGLASVADMAEEQERQLVKSTEENATESIPPGADLAAALQSTLERSWALLNARLQKDGIPQTELPN